MVKSRRQFTLYSAHKQLTRFKFMEISSFIDHSRQGMTTTWREFSDNFDKTTAS